MRPHRGRRDGQIPSARRQRAIYDTLVRMAQDFSLRYTLIDSQGNFGSVDGDNAAAMRYTECRLQKITAEMLGDLEKEHGRLPAELRRQGAGAGRPAAKFPESSGQWRGGIAVGMATNIPPHNLSEVDRRGRWRCSKSPDTDIEELIRMVPAPDFPTGGFIYGLEGVHSAIAPAVAAVMPGQGALRADRQDRPSGHHRRRDSYQVNKSTCCRRSASWFATRSSRAFPTCATSPTSPACASSSS